MFIFSGALALQSIEILVGILRNYWASRWYITEPYNQNKFCCINCENIIDAVNVIGFVVVDVHFSSIIINPTKSWLSCLNVPTRAYLKTLLENSSPSSRTSQENTNTLVFHAEHTLHFEIWLGVKVPNLCTMQSQGFKSQLWHTQTRSLLGS